MRDKILKIVTDIVAKGLGVKIGQVNLDTHLRDQGADSLDAVEAFMQIEDTFVLPDGGELKIPDDEADKLFTVNMIVDYLVKTGAVLKQK